MKIILVLSFVAVAAVAFAAGARISQGNSSTVKDVEGTITCSAGGTALFSDAIPQGMKFTGNIGYNGTLK